MREHPGEIALHVAKTSRKRSHVRAATVRPNTQGVSTPRAKLDIIGSRRVETVSEKGVGDVY
jgi:hypothetical protein